MAGEMCSRAGQHGQTAAGRDARTVVWIYDQPSSQRRERKKGKQTEVETRHAVEVVDFGFVTGEDQQGCVVVALSSLVEQECCVGD